MAKRKILRFIYFVITLPYLLFSKLAYQFNWWGFKLDAIQCFEMAKKFEYVQLPRSLLKTLQVAEDHRNNFHYGIDQIGFFRALYRTLRGNMQGASTIEQQFVRVVVNRYQRTISRKILEQLLAVYVASFLTKEHIATAYLCIAYYGDIKEDVLKLNVPINKNIASLKYYNSISIISRLKYPEPIIITNKWLTQLKNRNMHIAKQLNMAYLFKK